MKIFSVRRARIIGLSCHPELYTKFEEWLASEGIMNHCVPGVGYYFSVENAQKARKWLTNQGFTKK